GIRSASGSLGIKFFKPNGTLNRGSSSPPNFSFVQQINLDSTRTENYSMGYGHATVGTYSTGHHRIEFWWQGVKIGETSFTVY
ncbi:MAG: hypothetical protein ACE10K_07570, partial [Rhodothermales bacterium]